MDSFKCEKLDTPPESVACSNYTESACETEEPSSDVQVEKRVNFNDVVTYRRYSSEDTEPADSVRTMLKITSKNWSTPTLSDIIRRTTRFFFGPNRSQKITVNH